MCRISMVTFAVDVIGLHSEEQPTSSRRLIISTSNLQTPPNPTAKLTQRLSYMSSMAWLHV